MAELMVPQGVQEIFLEFRAGKMFMEGTRVVPDTRKGLVRIAKGDEGLVHFQWLDREQIEVEDDQIVFPDEAVFEKVAQSSGRVYILKFNTDDRKFFFWMQEPKADDDQQLCDSVNYYMNQPLDELEASEHLEAFEDMAEDDISSRAGNLVGPSVSAELTSDVTSSGPIKLEDLQRILSSFGSGGGAPVDFGDPDGDLGLSDILKPELILPLLETLPVEDRLGMHLPEGQKTLDDVAELVQSPIFRQQVDYFTYVLKTGQTDLSQFEIDHSKYEYTIVSFLELLDDSVSKQLEVMESRRELDSRSQTQGSSDPMDEGH